MRKNKPNPPKNTFKDKPAAATGKKDDLKGNEFSFKKFFTSFKDQRYRKIFGLLLIIISFYLFLAFTSYLFHWQDDDSYLEDKAFSFGLLLDSSVIAQNMMGRLGAVTSHIFIKKWFGISSFLFSLVAFVGGYRLMTKKSVLPVWKTIRYSFFAMIWFSVALGFVFTSEAWTILGGTFGYESNVKLNGIFGKIGTGFILLFALASFLIVVFNLNTTHFRQLMARLRKTTDETDASEEGSPESPEEGFNTDDTELTTQTSFEDLDSEMAIIEKIRNKGQAEKGIEEKKEEFFEFNVGEEEEMVKPTTNNESGADKNDEPKGPELEIEIADDTKISNSNYQPINDPFANATDSLSQDLGDYDPTLELPHYKIPPIDLMDDHGNSTINVNKEELEANKVRIVDTLRNYSIEIDKIKATIGPTVTLYEIIPAAGVRISKIRNLEDDIALSLSALGIRIIAPIPGRGTIGIEVPNSKPEIVSMKSILGSEKFQNSGFDLPIGLGKTIANETFIADLTKMPHLLMAGATGQGKSVGLNAILASILFKKHPAYVKFVLVDPKKVELTLFSKIERHYLAKLPDSAEAIITDTRKVVRTLNSLCIEMDNRYDMLKDAKVRNIKEYNAKFIKRKLNPNNGHHFLPYIILFIDEFADLIMTAGKEIELPIARLAQLARAIGIHLIIATQRPSVNIITGMIKANFPARIAFRVTSKIDSRTILDTGGADQLIGRGDMLLSTGSDLLRLQCAFIDTPEIERITDYIGSQKAFTDTFMLPEVADDEGGETDDFDPADRDELFEEAARVIVATQQGSTSLLQRKLKLGYNRAGRIIDQLEAAGIVGPFEGSKAREVRIKDEVSLEQILKGNYS
ncbi:MAG: DNA translocase FtsK [Bacteroidetes bacterium]|nr:MAG: DNA translocase FtsK [Bacteroidota bacterium]